ncbi:DUF2567 domain-containing protein [Micromonospora peucetia]|uniref:DUF2567 domain-containing protein n=1 Tax=Micromonospora peucetia TaxID=47871 RepID=UPI002B1CD9AE|nr:DUF2567 domain-containing protein [Micromonospora peucetia]
MSADTPEPDRPGHRPDEPGAPAAWAEPDPPAPGAPADPYAAREPAPPYDAPPYDTGPYDAATGAPSYGGAGEHFPGGTGLEYAAGYPLAQPVEPDLPRGRAVRLALLAVLAATVLGVPLGLLWAALAPDTPVVKVADGAIYAEPQPEQPIAADGWFSLLGLGFGVLVALALWFLLRRVRGPVGLFAAVFGTFGAALVAWQVGRRMGLAGYERLLESAPVGQALSKPADLRAGGIDWVFGVLPLPHGNLLLPAFGAAVTYTLLAGWSRWPSLRPEREPGPVEFSWGSAGTPAPPAAPEPPAPGAAAPPHG